MRHVTTSYSITHIHADARGPTPAAQAAQPFMQCRSTKQHSIYVNAEKPWNPKHGLCWQLRASRQEERPFGIVGEFSHWQSASLSDSERSPTVPIFSLEKLPRTFLPLPPMFSKNLQFLACHLNDFSLSLTWDFLHICSLWHHKGHWYLKGSPGWQRDQPHSFHLDAFVVAPL